LARGARPRGGEEHDDDREGAVSHAWLSISSEGAAAM